MPEFAQKAIEDHEVRLLKAKDRLEYLFRGIQDTDEEIIITMAEVLADGDMEDFGTYTEDEAFYFHGVLYRLLLRVEKRRVKVAKAVFKEIGD